MSVLTMIRSISKSPTQELSPTAAELAACELRRAREVEKLAHLRQEIKALEAKYRERSIDLDDVEPSSRLGELRGDLADCEASVRALTLKRDDLRHKLSRERFTGEPERRVRAVERRLAEAARGVVAALKEADAIEGDLRNDGITAAFACPALRGAVRVDRLSAALDDAAAEGLLDSDSDSN